MRELSQGDAEGLLLSLCLLLDHFREPFVVFRWGFNDVSACAFHGTERDLPSDLTIFDRCLGVSEASADAARKCSCSSASAVELGPVVAAPPMNVEPSTGWPSVFVNKLRLDPERRTPDPDRFTPAPGIGEVDFGRVALPLVSAGRSVAGSHPRSSPSAVDAPVFGWSTDATSVVPLAGCWGAGEDMWKWVRGASK